MSNFYRRLKVAFTVLRHYPVVTLPDFYWTPADSKAWSNFLSSDTGAKLRNIRFNRVYESQQRAICDRKDSAYSAGIAFGILAMTSEEDQLLQISLPTNESSENTHGTSDFRSVNR